MWWLYNMRLSSTSLHLSIVCAPHRVTAAEFPLPSFTWRVRCSSSSLSLRCAGAMGAKRTISILAGSAVSTSAFTRRSRKGFKISCSFVTTCGGHEKIKRRCTRADHPPQQEGPQDGVQLCHHLWRERKLQPEFDMNDTVDRVENYILAPRLTLLRCSCAMMAASPPAWPRPPKSNQDSKSSMLANTSGSRKLSRLHSSPRLFCSGVPVPTPGGSFQAMQNRLN